MFEYMTAEAARIEHNLAIARAAALAPALPRRISLRSRFTARFGHEHPVATIVTLPAAPVVATTADRYTAAA